MKTKIPLVKSVKKSDRNSSLPQETNYGLLFIRQLIRDGNPISYNDDIDLHMMYEKEL